MDGPLVSHSAIVPGRFLEVDGELRGIVMDYGEIGCDLGQIGCRLGQIGSTSVELLTQLARMEFDCVECVQNCSEV